MILIVTNYYSFWLKTQMQRSKGTKIMLASIFSAATVIATAMAMMLANSCIMTIAVELLL